MQVYKTYIIWCPQGRKTFQLLSSMHIFLLTPRFPHAMSDPYDTPHEVQTYMHYLMGFKIFLLCGIKILSKSKKTKTKTLNILLWLIVIKRKHLCL